MLRPVAAEGAAIHCREAAAPVAANVENRVDDQVHGHLCLAEDNADRVDQEWHVVGDDHDQGVGRLESIPLRVGIEHAHGGRPGFAWLRTEIQVIHGRMRERARRALREIFLSDSPEIGVEEALTQAVASASP